MFCRNIKVRHEPMLKRFWISLKGFEIKQTLHLQDIAYSVCCCFALKLSAEGNMSMKNYNYKLLSCKQYYRQLCEVLRSECWLNLKENVSSAYRGPEHYLQVKVLHKKKMNFSDLSSLVFGQWTLERDMNRGERGDDIQLRALAGIKPRPLW